jgi:hypothetical protein
MDHIAQLMSIGIPPWLVLVGVLINNSPFTDLRSHMDVRFTAQEQVFTERLQPLRGSDWRASHPHRTGTEAAVVSFSS